MRFLLHCLTLSLFDFITLTASLPPRLACFLYPGRWLQTPGIPHGSLTRRSWTLQACLNCRVGRVEKKGPKYIHKLVKFQS